VVEADVMASNGVVHVVDALLVPPSMIGLMQDTWTDYPEDTDSTDYAFDDFMLESSGANTSVYGS
jgi:hypothetical protein